MSKPFDTVNSRILLEHLQEVLQPDELHLMSILTNRPNITVSLDGEKGDGFDTYRLTAVIQEISSRGHLLGGHHFYTFLKS